MLEFSHAIQKREPVVSLREVENRFPLSEKQSRLLARGAELVTREAERIEKARSSRACSICRESLDLYAGLEPMDDFTVDSLFDVYSTLTNSTRIPSQGEKWCRNCCEILASVSRALDEVRRG